MMIGSDEMILTGRHKGFQAGIRFDLQGKGPAHVVSAIRQVIGVVEPSAFAFSGIDAEKIDAFAEPEGRGLDSVCAFLSDKTPKEISSVLESAMGEPLLKSVGESYLMNRLLDKAQVGFRPFSEERIESSKEEIGDSIAFIAKYGNWLTIKKLGLEGAQDYEVSAILAGITHSTIRKGFELSGAGKGAETAVSIIKGKRKSYGNLKECLDQASGKLSGDAQEDALMVMSLFDGLGYCPYANPAMLSAAHHDIKIPKMRGRKPKG